MTFSDAITSPNRDLALCHPLVQARWPALQAHLRFRYDMRMFLNEGYRSDERQMFLYGKGRTAEQLVAAGLDPMYAQPGEARVTNAKNASKSAHGWAVNGKPAAAAIDVVPLGADGKPWTKDDPWDQFVLAIAEEGAHFGLVHFHSPGKGVWDKPHCQLVEWSDREKRLLVP